MYQNFIGIDIGKESFYLAIHGGKHVKEFDNTASGFQTCFDSIKVIAQESLIVLETTGGYEMGLIRFLQGHQCAVHRANTRKVKHFIRSLGQLGKSDAIDARGLAHYGFERHTSLEIFVENPQQRLLKLVKRRQDLKAMMVKEKNRLKAPEQDELTESIQTILVVLQSEITKIEKIVADLYTEIPNLAEKQKVLQTVPGIGPVISSSLLAFMPELGMLDRRKIASLGGLAPHPNESGKKVGYRYTRGGRIEVKTLLFTAAMTAARSNSRLGEYYQGLIARGKKKMVALVALMRKILVIANARIRDYMHESSDALCPQAHKAEAS